MAREVRERTRRKKVSTFEREFLADIMLPDGSTFHEAVTQGRADKVLGPADGSVPLLPPTQER